MLHAVVVAILALGLSALNVGLGAYLPTFQETDPSKIVVGFGGTVNMVTGLGFLIAVIGLMAVPFHAAQLANRATGGADQSLGLRGNADRACDWSARGGVAPAGRLACRLREMEF